MNIVTKILFGVYFFCLSAGVLAAIPVGIPGVTIYAIDVIAVCSLPLALWLGLRNTKQVVLLPVVLYGGIFACVCGISLLFTPVSLSPPQQVISSLYLVRWLVFASVFVVTTVCIRKLYFTKAFILLGLQYSSLTVALLGWVQYALYPNLRNLEYLGWDPHFERIFSTYLDPNYLGLLLILGMILWAAPLIIGTRQLPMRSWWGVGLLLITLLFTYSRSSYVTLLCVMGWVSFRKGKWQILAAVMGVVLLAVLLLPQPPGEGGQWSRLYSVFSRAQSWQTGITLFLDHPLLGVGFNTLRYAKQQSQSESTTIEDNHAGAGIDNSFIFVAATTGIVGLASFLYLLWKMYERSQFLGQASLVAILIHSLFQNSLFYPWVMLWMWIVLAEFRRTPVQEE